MDLGLKGKRAIVTGASRGIGNACALALAAEGARVCVTARNEELLAQTVKDIDASGGEAMFVAADLTSVEGCKGVVGACVEKWGGVDVLVNVAGAAGGGDILDRSGKQLLVSRGDANPGTFGGQRQRTGVADPPAGAGDDGAFSFKS